MSAKRFLISVIGLNRLAATKTCLQALFQNSNAKDFDLVLTNNASSDETGDYFDQLAADNPNVTVFHEKENTGFIPPNNRAFDLAIKRGAKYFVALNNDTVPERDWLNKLADPLDRNPNGALCGPMGGCSSLHFNMHGHAGEKFEYVEGSCLCVKVNIVREYAPLFSDYLDFIYGDDSDLSLRMRARGHSIHLANFTLKHTRGETVQRQPEVKKRCDEAQAHNHEVLRHRWAAYLTTRRFDYDILIKRQYAIGDVLLITPIIRAIHHANPQVKIHVETDFPDIFINNPLVKAAHKTGMLTVPKKPAAIINLDNAYENRPGMHIVHAYEESAREQYGLIDAVELATSLYPAQQDQSWARQLRGKIGDSKSKLCLLHCGPTNWPGKNWHTDRFAKLATSLVLSGWHVAAVGLGRKPQAVKDCVDLTGNRFTIQQLAALMKLSQLFIGVDSFPMHCAQAVGLPTIGLFGCTSSKYIMTLGSPHVGINADPDIPCAGERHRRSNITFLQCEPDCINSIEVETVLEAVKKMS